MASIGDTLRRAWAVLAAGSDSARLDAEVLLSHVLGKPRSHLMAWPDKTLTAAEADAFDILLNRRLAGEPIAYLTGIREFWSREFVVTPDVLIPRPETELLVELTLAKIPEGLAVEVADLGTGSGAIGITLALERPRSRITALDFSAEALAIARLNAERHGANNLTLLQSDWYAALRADAAYDVIVSNPPYIADTDPHLQQGDVRFEPLAALRSGGDGLDDIRRIIAGAIDHLKPGGWLLFEHGYDQGEATPALLRDGGFSDVRVERDLQGNPRVSLGRKRG